MQKLFVLALVVSSFLLGFECRDDFDGCFTWNAGVSVVTLFLVSRFGFSV